MSCANCIFHFNPKNDCVHTFCCSKNSPFSLLQNVFVSKNQILLFGNFLGRKNPELKFHKIYWFWRIPNLQKEPFLRALKILKFRFWVVFCSIFNRIELESALRLGFRQTFFPGIRKFRDTRKKWCRFQEKLFSSVF